MEDTFPAKSAEEIIGLLYLGQLTKTVHWGGHEVVLRTIRNEEELAIGLLTKEYVDSVMLAKAIATATVAAAIDKIDGKELVIALGPDHQVTLEQKFYHVRKWFWPTIEKYYNEYIELQDRQIKAYAALEGKS